MMDGIFCYMQIKKFEEILDNLHPNIDSDLSTSSADDTDNAIHHLDLTIYIKEGKTDNFISIFY